jgi:nicotinamidase-related amidase
MLTVSADPYEFEFDPSSTAVLMIDFQRDFVEPGGFGEALGNDVARLGRAVPAAARVLRAARQKRLFIVHTREGHRPDMSDCPPSKRARGRLAIGMGSGAHGTHPDPRRTGARHRQGPHPRWGEPVVDKPGKGAFYATDLDALLRSRGVQQLIVCGVTTEVCVQTTVREANDRGYDCLVLAACVASYSPELHEAALKMIAAQGGISGWVSDSSRFLRSLEDANLHGAEGLPAPSE